MNEEMTKNFTYHADSLQTHFSVKYLLELEQRIIASMLASKEVFDDVVSQCGWDDFTFYDHKTIIDFFDSRGYETIESPSERHVFLESMIDDISTKYPIACIPTIIKAVQAKPSESLDLDICELLAYSKEKIIAMQRYEDDAEKRKIIVRIENKHGDFTGVYWSDRLCEIQMTNFSRFPTQYCDTYMETFEKLLPIINDNSLNPSEVIPGEVSPFDGMKLIVHVDIVSIESINRLIQWAVENNIDETVFPRTKEQLSAFGMAELENLGLKEIPTELLSLFLVSLNIKDNQITKLPEGNWHPYYFWDLSACNNQLSSLPKSLFEAKRIKFLCLHNNRFESLPEEIGNLTNLLTLSISNNPIRTLPGSFRNLSGLEELDIENTLIEVLPEWIFEFNHLKKISFDDKHLPFLMQNKEFFSRFEIINLSHSEYDENHELINECGLKIEYDNWMEPSDYQGHGCIVLTKVMQ